MAIFKVGDKVKVIEKSYGYKVGDIGTITKIDCQSSIKVVFDYDYFWICDFQLEFIEGFTKSDLKSGMLVVKRNGNKELIIGEYLMASDCGFNCLSSVKEDLTNTNSKEFDIVDVYDINTHTIGSFKSDSFDIERLTRIYKREETKVIKELTIEDIQKELGYEFKIIKGDK